MADLFSVTAPLLLRSLEGHARVAVASYSHPEGVVFVVLAGNGCSDLEVSLLRGELRGDGPWKAGDTVITLLGCQGTHPEQAAQYAGWKAECEMRAGCCPGRDELRQLVCEAGF